MKNIFLAATVLGGLFLTACNPNEDIYSKLDDANALKPYTELNVPYTINDVDYDLAGNKTIKEKKAFNDSLLPDVFIPKILTKKFLALKVGSTVSVTYNYTGINPSYVDKTVFAYTMDAKDYDAIGGAVATGDCFSPTDSAKKYLPAYLLTLAPKAKANDTLNVIFTFVIPKIGTTPKVTSIKGETYKFDGTAWSLVREFRLPEIIGYSLFPSDYYQFGGNIAYNSNFSVDYPAEKYLPGFLNWKYPVAVAGDFKVLGYKFYDGKKTYFNTAKYIFDGSLWKKQANTDLYVNDPINGWMFSTDKRIKMVNADYADVLEKDTLKDSYGTAGYLYGASTYKNNFDLRISAWKAGKGAARFTGMSDDQAKTYITEQVKKGIIVLLQKRYPDAQPLVKGVNAYFIVTFETYNNDLTRSYPTWKFQCTAAGSPATFVFVEAVQ